ncbi:MAG: hypothetical protein D8M58_19460 [Calditrichaeota bacterium]|nr:MAG: hypothetical protein DWQ03_22140 [Calditrichota bacterium]MBL1207590.1 hypothetical protein [Calditrichota bacterium]NOG47423.1 hypothetical protein [Calditrichota bacterium]
MRKLYLLYIILLSASFSFAGKYAASFLELGIGARALGMGNAHVALSDDAYGFYWNPSGMAFLNNFQAASMRADLFNSLEQQNFVSAAMPVFGGVTVALSWVRLSVDDIPRYQSEGLLLDASQRYAGNKPLIDESKDSFSASNDAFVLSFAKYQRVMVDLGWQYFEFPIDFGYGVNFKMINESLDQNNGSGVGIDLGVLLKMGLSNVFNDENYGDLMFGLNAQDIAETKITWDTASKRKDTIERNFKFGFAYMQPLNFMNSQLTMAFDLDSRYSGASHLGSELLYDSFLAIRMGSNESKLTIGAGVYLWKFRADYALQGHDLGDSHRVSILFNL